MFGGDKNKPARPAAGVETLIGARVTLRGDLVFSGGLYVEGAIHGAVLAEEGAGDAVLTLAERGNIQGEVRAPHVIVNGQLSGDVYAGDRIELGPTARIQGNIYYKVIEMAAGAMVTGRMIHGDAPKQLPKPEAAPTKAARTADAEAAT
ncbi:MAG: polymer-forming cytoskeletal protein [Lysobacteraceae bacterium]